MHERSSRNRTMAPPRSVEELRAEIVNRHEALSRRLQQVAQFVMDNPNDIALETLTVIGERSGVQPSTIVRFAKFFGFSGASQMQKVFRNELVNSSASPSYSQRIRHFNRNRDRAMPMTALTMLREFAESNIIALQHLKDAHIGPELDESVQMLARAESVYLVGLRRSFPVAAYLAYALRHVEKKCHLIDGLAGMLSEQTEMMTRNDMLIAISFRPYAPETIGVVTHARQKGTKIIAISDSRLSSISKLADVVFETQDAEVRGFRSLTASLCLAQSLAISFAWESRPSGPRKRKSRTGGPK